jgi:hypothetical protein
MLFAIVGMFLADWIPSVSAKAIECTGKTTILVDRKKDQEIPISNIYVIDDEKESVAMFYPESPPSDGLPFRPDLLEVVCGPACKKFWQSTSIYISGTNAADEEEIFELDRINGTLKASEAFEMPELDSDRKEHVERKHELTCKPTSMPVLKTYKTKF